MEALHQHKYPGLVILASLLQPLHRRHDLIAVVDIVTHHSTMRKLSLLGTEPAGCAGCVGEEDGTCKSDDESHHTLEDEEPSFPCQINHSNARIPDERYSPSPSRKTFHAIQPLKYTCSNQRRETRRRNLRKIQTSNPRCNLLSRIEN